jgi:osmoprotectant transport system permease protein
MRAVWLRGAVAVAMLAFLAWPEAFAPVFAPLTRYGAAPIYLQTPLWSLMLGHLALVGAAVSAAALLGIGLAVLTTRAGGRDFLPLARLLANLGQTFPPVAVLALAVPIFGFGTVPTLIALFLYALLPIFETALTGLLGVPAAVREAAAGMGMHPAQRLWQVELPLALPQMLTGLRLSAVIALATATLGSTVAARSLGEVILAGLQTGNTAFVAQGALLVGGLAVLTDAGFRALEALVRRRLGQEAPGAQAAGPVAEPARA